MSSRRLVVGFLCGSIAASSFLFGCAAPNKMNKPDAQVSVGTTMPSELSPSTPAGNGEMPGNETEPVALQSAQRRAEQFAQSLQSIMAKRSGSSAAQPSQVRWADPGEFRLSSGPGLASGESDAQRSGQPIAYKPGGTDGKSVPLADGSSILTSAAAPGSDHLGMTGAVATNSPLSLTEAVEPTPAPQPARAATSDLYTLERRLSARVREYPRDVAGQLEYQMLLYLMDQPVPQLAPLAAMPSEDRELVAALMDGLSNFRSTVRSDNNMLLSKKIHPILDLADRVRTQADLNIGNVSLCKAVRGFGDYDPIEPQRFEAGREAKFISYCEVSNFASTLTDKQRWETRLSLELVVYTENGMQVWSAPPEVVTELSRVKRHDFFLVKKVVLPANLAIGRYMLKVTVVDNQVNRVSEATVPLIIGAK